LLLQKTYWEDHITKKTLINRGKLPMYHAENTHEAIVSMEVFQAVQEEMERRAAKHRKCTERKVYPFTSNIVCDTCGKHYRRKVTRTGPVWICGTFNLYGKSACPSKQIPEGTLEKAAADALGLDSFDPEVFHNKITAVRTEKTTHWYSYSRTAHKPLNGGKTAPGPKAGPRK